jgi:hypothetical protein
MSYYFSKYYLLGSHMNKLIRSMTSIFFFIIMLFASTTTFAHLISITASTPFPTQVNSTSVTSGSFTVTNISTRTPLTVQDQSQLPSAVSIINNTCGHLLNPGASCVITLQLNAPTSPQVISMTLREKASPSADGVKFPISVSIIAGSKPKVTLKSIVISPTNTNLKQGSTVQLTAVGTNSDNTTVNLTSLVTWSSSNASATVNSTGLVTAQSDGSTTINATYQSIQSNASAISVIGITSLIISTAATTTHIRDTTIPYTATINYNDGSTQDVTTLASWNSFDNGIASIDNNGVATIHNSGTTNINATYSGVTSNTSALTGVAFAYIKAASSPGFYSYKCPINNTGTIGSLATCIPTIGHTGSNTWETKITKIGNDHYIYIGSPLSGSYTTSYCKIDDVTGDFSACNDVTMTFDTQRGVEVINVADINYVLYSNDNGGLIFYCALDSNGAYDGNNCAVLGSGFSRPFAITAYEIAGTRFLYVANVTNNTISACPITQTGQLPSLGTCFTAASGFTSPLKVTIHNVAGVDYAYIAGDGTPLMYQCRIKTSGGTGVTGAFDTCTTTNMGHAVAEIAFVNVSGTDYGYIARGNSSLIDYCQIDSTTGAIIQPCATSDSLVSNGYFIINTY